MTTPGPIEIIEPLGRAWQRTRALLFAPFAFERWAIFGFSAWLALWTGMGSSSNMSWLVSPPTSMPGPLSVSRDEISSWFFGLAFVVVVLLSLLVFGWILLRTWLRSRFDFVFLNHLVTGETAIAKPWADFGARGQSLFVWRVLLGLGFLCLILLPIALALGAGLSPGVMSIGALVLGLILLVPIAVAGALLIFAIDQFVVPVMARQDLAFPPALARVRDLVAAQPTPFVLYTLMYLVLAFAVSMVILAVGFATCCVGFLIVSLPYVGAVVVLPVGVCARYYGLEFLRQFGPEFDLLTPAPLPAPLTPPGSEYPPLSPLPGPGRRETD